MNADISYQTEITISNDLIALLGKKLYSNPLTVILPRELLQNSIDASQDSTIVRIDYSSNRDDTLSLTVSDLGCGMDKDTLLNTFLCIGKTKKSDNVNNVGGFGIAKVSLFASKFWSVNTTCGKVNSTGIELSFNPNEYTKQGTTVNATIENQYSDKVQMLYTNNPTGNKRIKLNGKFIKNYDGKIIDYVYYKELQAKIKLAKVLTYQSLSGYDEKMTGCVVYRINGLTQFINKIDYDAKFNLIVDFDDIGYKPKDDNYPFSMSRESVSYDISYPVNRIMTQLVTDKNSTADRTNNPNGNKKVTNSINSNGRLIKKVWGNGQFTKVDNWLCDIYQDMIEIISIKTNTQTNKFGLSQDKGYLAANESNGEIYWINSQAILSGCKNAESLVMTLLALSTHEFTHNYYDCHNEDFTSKHVWINQFCGKELFDNMSKYLKIARKIYQKSDI
jgi:hypothetical protein